MTNSNTVPKQAEVNIPLIIAPQSRVRMLLSKGSDSMFIVWILAIALIVHLVIRGKGCRFAGTNAAEETLKARYVKGEIDEETYLKMKKIINQ